jgi:phosphohistidine swiveling domain-containing protein
MASHLRALCLTPSAREWLAHTTAARVLNSFERACNLINQEDEILALVTSERGLTPFALVVASEAGSPFRGVSAASRVRVRPDGLSVDSLYINIESAGLWDPVPDWPALRPLLAGNPALLEALTVTALEVTVRGSLLELYRLRPVLRSGGGRGSLDQVLLERVRRGGTELVNGFLAGSPEHCLVGARLLAGSGGGLTPAGDDFMVGVLLGVWAGLFGEGREQLGRSMVRTAAPLTTTLSAAYLRAAARGECAQHWHALFRALLASDASAIHVAVQALTTIGHTSGADALAGFLSCCHFTNQLEYNAFVQSGGYPRGE